MSNDTWLDKLQCLITRLAYLGIGSDIAALSIVEAWGLYCFLTRLADGG